METTTTRHARAVTAFYVDVGRRLTSTRHARGWSLTDAERRSGGQFKAVVVGSYERGDRRVSLESLYALADLYEVPVGTFLPDPERKPRTMVAVDDVIRMLTGLDPADYELKA